MQPMLSCLQINQKEPQHYALAELDFWLHQMTMYAPTKCIDYSRGTISQHNELKTEQCKLKGGKNGRNQPIKFNMYLAHGPSERQASSSSSSYLTAQERAGARREGCHESGSSWALSSRCASSCSCCASLALASICASYLRSLSSVLACKRNAE